MEQARRAAAFGLVVAVLVCARLLSVDSGASSVDLGPVLLLLIAGGFATMAKLSREPAVAGGVVGR